MYINKEYLASLHNLIKFTPWRVNDDDLLCLLNFTETLVWEYETLKQEHSDLISRSINHTDLLRNQLITSLLNNGKLNAKEEAEKECLDSI